MLVFALVRGESGLRGKNLSEVLSLNKIKLIRIKWEAKYRGKPSGNTETGNNNFVTNKCAQMRMTKGKR